MPGAGGRGVELIVGRTARSAERGPSSASWPPASSIAHLWACLMPASAALVPSVVPHRSLQRPRFAVRTQNCTQHRLRASQYAAPISQTHKKHACPCQAFSSSFRPVDSACFIHLHIPGRTRALDSLAVVDKKSSPPGPARALPCPPCSAFRQADSDAFPVSVRYRPFTTTNSVNPRCWTPLHPSPRRSNYRSTGATPRRTPSAQPSSKSNLPLSPARCAPSVSRSCSLLSFCDCALYVRPRSTVRHRGCISPTSSTGRRRL